MTYFLRKFPGYTFDSLMNEYAVRVYSLINQSLRLDAMEKLELARIALLSNMKKDDVEKTLKMYNRNSEDPIEKFLLRDKKAEAMEGLNRLEKVLGGR